MDKRTFIKGNPRRLSEQGSEGLKIVEPSVGRQDFREEAVVLLVSVVGFIVMVNMSRDGERQTEKVLVSYVRIGRPVIG